MSSTNPVSPFHPPLPTQAGAALRWQQLHGSALAVAVRAAATKHQGLTVVIAADSQSAQDLENDIRALDPGDDLPVAHFPDWETLPYDLFSPHPDIISERLASLYRLPQLKRGVLVLPAATLMQRVPPHDYLTGNTLILDTGQRLDLDDMRDQLETAGYRCVSQVTEPGDFAVRGALLDLYPMGVSAPYRIELFDDEVESIRTFDPDSQRSLDKVESVRLLPAREVPFDDKSTRAFRAAFRERFEIDTRQCPLYQDVRNGVAPAGIEYYLPLFFERTETLFGYLGKQPLFIALPGVTAAAEHFWQHARDRYEQRRHDPQRPVLTPEELFVDPDTLRSKLDSALRIEAVLPGREADDATGDSGVDFATEPVPELRLHGGTKGGATLLKDFIADYDGRLLLAAESAGRREALLEALSEQSIGSVQVASWSELVHGETKLAVGVVPVTEGLCLTDPPLTVVTDGQLFGERVQQRRRRRQAARDPETIIRDLAELQPGAPVVHEDYGVGRYQGLQRLQVGDHEAEFLTIEYANEDRLYVPVASLHLVSRYTGSSPEEAPLHRMGSDQWQRAKRKAAKKARDVAAELLDLYAKREARQGEALPLDKEMYHDFASSFPFEETPDQEAAIERVIDNLVKPQSMDMVVCGDVGFGKTEVALRAAFVAAQAGKQVALLVPTTLLAQQHFENFRDRLADWPMRVEVLSRFRSQKQTKAVLDAVTEGKVDILIGTHRLLQKDLKFKDLGLIIVDEEQRFGVRQKEKLKALRAEVDVLTLTATPIPRTLNMSLSGLRDLAIIATPPPHRMAVKTFISEWDGNLIREACQRELQRGGQVYFLHNEVQSIDKVAREVSELLPEARVRIAHGQMPERELEQVMFDFYRHRFNILVCTTIIENGIDIPSANTIVMNRADRFGLAQLHQLRGRVGRSHHRAYAYLIVPERSAMTADAEKRLAALESLEDLGAGFTLATHDLEIRGAGELLGEEQSGQIQEVGFSMYNELLHRAVKALQAGEEPESEPDFEHGAEVELHMPALIPDDYLPDVHARLTLYKRIASAEDSAALRELQVEMIDRFGLLPEAAKNLFTVTELKLKASALGITKLEVGPGGGRVHFASQPQIDPGSVVQLVQTEPHIYRLDDPQRLRFTMELPEAEQRVRVAHELLDRFDVRQAA